ncbi:MAG: pantoate--beta-alanine ligase [Negativicoccus succinicivorans]|uniref:pantoate--beta-alanine ligase n=1 Tax=Negativicoccus succinicivorans TaxID=620903 RepID=UPI00290784AA|nr:pantoate--beta-alanine ligase [Negativicoccus succinicivorans]MDU4558561.1 pantoate--beta-alanine ligase [Negativicoccus succinicivorans]MDU4575784.1 pantoate--beta-alanine ligase [Negativicoccus succinicivorans]
MQICTTVAEVRALVDAWHKEGKTVGLVPTMGFLHEGHESLIQKAVAENDCVVVSDFVNPTQFGPQEDLEAYPRDFEQDKARCEKIGAAAIFHPAPEEMYHDPATYVNIERLSSTLCGQSRPIHFRGVCTVVSKLFNIVRPERAYFGEKDAQQLAIIRKMVTDLNFPVTIVGCPIVREADGLAKSSRNTYLSEAERRAALCLSQAVKKGQQTIAPKMAAADVLRPMGEILENEPLARVDYLEMVDAQTMQPADRVDRAVLVAMAVYIGKTRLIDNFSFDPAGAR